MLSRSTFEQGAKIRTEYTDELPLIPGDYRQLSRVFYNLIKNAAEAIVARGESGDITVRTGFDQARRSVVVSFSDNGIGIQPGNRDRIFDPYFTTKTGRKGFGLGLAYAKQVVEQHGGNIEVDPRPGHGAVFTVYLPIREE